MASPKTEELIELGAEINYLRAESNDLRIIVRGLALMLLDSRPGSRNDLRIPKELAEEAQNTALNWRQLGDGRIRLDIKRAPKPKPKAKAKAKAKKDDS